MCVPVILVDKWMDNSSQPRTFSIDADVIHKTIRAVKEIFLFNVISRIVPKLTLLLAVARWQPQVEMSSSATYYDANHVPSM